MPSMPSHSGREAGNAPRPIRVEVTGESGQVHQLAQQALASGPELTMPPPV